jgi:hypothetical protein
MRGRRGQAGQTQTGPEPKRPKTIANWPKTSRTG